MESRYHVSRAPVPTMAALGIVPRRPAEFSAAIGKIEHGLHRCGKSGRIAGGYEPRGLVVIEDLRDLLQSARDDRSRGSRG